MYYRLVLLALFVASSSDRSNVRLHMEQATIYTPMNCSSDGASVLDPCSLTVAAESAVGSLIVAAEISALGRVCPFLREGNKEVPVARLARVERHGQVLQNHESPLPLAATTCLAGPQLRCTEDVDRDDCSADDQEWLGRQAWQANSWPPREGVANLAGVAGTGDFSALGLDLSWEHVQKLSVLWDSTLFLV